MMLLQTIAAIRLNEFRTVMPRRSAAAACMNTWTDDVLSRLMLRGALRLFEVNRDFLFLFSASLGSPFRCEEPVESHHFCVGKMGKLFLCDKAHDTTLRGHVTPSPRYTRLHEPAKLRDGIGLDDYKRRSIDDVLVRLVMTVDAADRVCKVFSRRT